MVVARDVLRRLLFDIDSRHVDLVLANRTKDTITILLGVGNGTFMEPFNFSVDNVKRRQPTAIFVGDLNGDGRVDVMVACAGTDDVSVLLRSVI